MGSLLQWDNAAPLGDVTVPVCNVCRAVEDDGAAKIHFSNSLLPEMIYLQGPTSI